MSEYEQPIRPDQSSVEPVQTGQRFADLRAESFRLTDEQLAAFPPHMQAMLDLIGGRDAITNVLRCLDHPNPNVSMGASMILYEILSNSRYLP